MSSSPGDPVSQTVAKAYPTKRFFVEMLSKDIGLMPAISDLVDNCVDGARRNAPGADYSEFWVSIRVTEKSFVISDNCGGIPVETARDYAFRFGRPVDAPDTRHSVGQFGVGMKRAIFKIGANFQVASRSDDESFLVDVDVDQWVAGGQEQEDWVFPMTQPAPDDTIEPDRLGTTVSVARLRPDVATEFARGGFPPELADYISRRHQAALDVGMRISVNGTPVGFRPNELLTSDSLKPAIKSFEWTTTGRTVLARIYAGVSTSSPSDAGWYVYLNGRLVLGADKTPATGWGWNPSQGVTDDTPRTPKFHTEFATFRGYAFLDSDFAGALPWNTTKTALNEDDPVYRALRRELVVAMRPVIDFLARLQDERNERRDNEGPLALQVLEARPQPLPRVATADQLFLAPAPAPRPVPGSSIQYRKEQAKIDKLKDALGATSNRELGEMTFDYVYRLEVDD